MGFGSVSVNQEALLIGLVLHEAFVELCKRLGFLTFLENYTREPQGPRALRLAWLFESCTATLPPVPSPPPPVCGETILAKLHGSTRIREQGRWSLPGWDRAASVHLPPHPPLPFSHFPSGTSRTSGKSRLMWERPEHGYDCPWRKSYFPDT